MENMSNDNDSIKDQEKTREENKEEPQGRSMQKAKLLVIMREIKHKRLSMTS